MSNLGLKSIETALHSPGIHYRNPTIPSAMSIPGGMLNGSKIYIAGCVAKEPDRFSINLQRGDAEGVDIFFHFDVRFNENAIVRNACFGGVWGEEERDLPLFPFEPRKAFIMSITANNDTFIVDVDGNELITFPNRNESINNITHVSVYGSVYLSEVHLPFHDNQSRKDLLVGIPGYARIGDMLLIKGKTPSGRERFAINLQTGPSSADNIAYHFNARFKGDDMIVLNHRSEDGWGEEIRVNDTEDFKVSTHLDDVKLLISIEEESLKASINGHEIDAFRHRIGLNSIKYLSVESDLLLSDVYYLGFPSKTDKYRVKVLKSGKIALPFNAEIPECKSVVVSGLVPDSPERFYINLQLNNSDIAIHFNPRWNDAKCEGECLVVNTKTNGEWGTEIREPLQLSPKMYYEFIFQFNGQNEINVAIDGCGLNRGKVVVLNHAFNNSDVKQLEVDGSFEAKQISCIY